MPAAKILAWVLLLLLGSSRAWAQHEADNWYFNERAGFTFRAGAPQVLLDGQMTAFDASTVLSDPATGQLRLYSDGGRVWGRDHRVMPNGSDLWGSLFPDSPTLSPSYATQGALLVPVPGDAAGYYLFTLRAGKGMPPSTVPANTYASSLAYSQVDMRRNNGLGDVVPETKNRRLATGLTEKLTAVRHANGRDYWVLCHEWLSNAFVVYPVTAAGVGPAARYAVGPVEPADTIAKSFSYFQDQVSGAMQAAPNGRKLAFGHVTSSGTRPPLGLFDFNPATGAVSNYVSLGPLIDANSPCFSPDNTKLYVPDFRRTPNGPGRNVITQFDLQAGDGAAIAASGQSIVAGNPATNISSTVLGEFVYLLQNGPDGRMYGASGYQGPGALPGDAANVFYVINRPNARGFACDVRAQRFDFVGRDGTGGLPNFMQHYFNGREPAPADAACDPAQTTVFPNPATATFRVRQPGPCALPYALAVYDAVGRKVLGQTVADPAREAPVEVAGLAAGVYVVELRFAQRTVVKKLVKL